MSTTILAASLQPVLLGIADNLSQKSTVPNGLSQVMGNELPQGKFFLMHVTLQTLPPLAAKSYSHNSRAAGAHTCRDFTLPCNKASLSRHHYRDSYYIYLFSYPDLPLFFLADWVREHIYPLPSNMSKSPHSDKVPTLLAKASWALHPILPSEVRSTISKFIQELPDLHCEEPIDGEQFLWSNDILDDLQDFAFTQGFTVVILSGSQNKGRMRFGCVHHGKPRDTRKMDDSETEIGRYKQPPKV